MSEKIFRQPSVMNAEQHFAKVPSVSVPRSTFDRSHAYKTTFDAGQLIPFFWDEVLPGDSKKISATAFCRLATPLHPLMDNMYVDIHWFFVPERLTWNNFQQFMGERIDPDDDPNDLSIPQATIVLGDIKPTSVLSYFGLPYMEGVTAKKTISALPLRAYHLIWNQWYRDENLQESIPVHLGDGPDHIAHLHDDGSCLPRNKRKDYITGCLPWPQKGAEVLLPLGDAADVIIDSPFNIAVSETYQTGGTPGSKGVLHLTSSTKQLMTTNAPSAGDPTGEVRGTVPQSALTASNMRADLANATSISINEFRLAVAVQQLLERDARGGTRYIELILSQFGVASDDARLQRPEYLGGSSSPVTINPVAATATSTQHPQGNLAAIGTSVANGGFSKSFTEHGFIIGIASVRADLTYQQGIERGWLRKTRAEHYMPALAHLGEQAVLNSEVYAQADAADDEVFGYQERWAEYRYKPSRITGLMASEQPTSLDVWHLSQQFGERPALNAEFIKENPPIDRCIAVPAEPHFIADFWVNYKDTRPMPIYSVPGLERL